MGENDLHVVETLPQFKLIEELHQVQAQGNEIYNRFCFILLMN